MCDKRLYRLMQYIQSTLEYRQYGWTDGDVSNMTLHVFSDADFAGCSISNRSTTGAHVSIEGKRTKFPIANTSKQTGMRIVKHNGSRNCGGELGDYARSNTDPDVFEGSIHEGIAGGGGDDWSKTGR